MQPLSPKDYSREMRAADLAKDAAATFLASLHYAFVQCATAESEEFYLELQTQIKDMASDIRGHEQKIFEASLVRPEPVIEKEIA